MKTFPTGDLEVTGKELREITIPTRYCSICGKEKPTKLSSEGYSEETGEKIYYVIYAKDCGAGDCQHYHHAWKNDGWFSGTTTCTRCGMTMSNEVWP